MYEKILVPLDGSDAAEIVLPYVPDWAEPVWHQFVIRHPQRDALQKHLHKNGIGTLIHYPVPPHLSNAYSYLGWGRGCYPLAEKLAKSKL